MAKSPAGGVARKAPPRRGKKAPISPEAQAAIDEIQNPLPVEDPHENARAAHTRLVAGASWEEILTEFEFPSMGEATLAVQAYLSYVHVMTGDDERQYAKRRQLDRLETLWREWHALGTTMKDKDAARVLLEINRQIVSLQELDNMSQRQGSSQTIVITAVRGDMAGQLEAMALAQERRKEIEGNVIDVEAQDVVVYPAS